MPHACVCPCFSVCSSFVAMFCAAFPLAAAAAFVTNLIEMRLDAHKFLTSQRPLPQAANGIGVWFPIMQLLSTFAVVTNIVWIYLSTSEEDSTGNFSSSLEKLLPSLGQVRGQVAPFGLGAVWHCSHVNDTLACAGWPCRGRVCSGAPADPGEVGGSAGDA